MKYYQKSIITSPLTGMPRGVTWISVGDGSGVAEVSSPDAQAFLDGKIKACRGGINAITAEEFEQKKSSPLKRRFVTEVRVPQSPPLSGLVAPPADGSGVASFSVTPAEAKPSRAPEADAPSVGSAPTGVVPPSAGFLEEP